MIAVLSRWMVIAVVVFAAACNSETHGRRSVAQLPRPANLIAAGPNEKSFSEKYAPDLNLPMPETRFIQLVEGFGLSYRLDRERGVSAVMPMPRWNSSLDISIVKRMYVIEGGYDQNSQVTERYRAYVSDSEEVVYIENNFVYPPIG